MFLLELAEEAIPMMNSMCDLAAELVPTAQMLCAGRGIEIGVALLEIHILACAGYLGHPLGFEG